MCTIIFYNWIYTLTFVQKITEKQVFHKTFLQELAKYSPIKCGEIKTER